MGAAGNGRWWGKMGNSAGAGGGPDGWQWSTRACARAPVPQGPGAAGAGRLSPGDVGSHNGTGGAPGTRLAGRLRNAEERRWAHPRGCTSALGPARPVHPIGRGRAAPGLQQNARGGRGTGTEATPGCDALEKGGAPQRQHRGHWQGSTAPTGSRRRGQPLCAERGACGAEETGRFGPTRGRGVRRRDRGNLGS